MKNVFERIGLVNRKVEKRKQEGRPAYAIISKSTYDTHINDLWDAITNKERLPRWFSTVNGDFRLGGRFQVKDNAEGSITKCAEPEHLELTWEFSGDISWVKVELTPIEQKTQLILEHLAYAEGEHFHLYGPGAVGVGWDLGVAALDYYLRTGQTADQNEFGTSVEWKKFASFCAQTWGKASIEAGFDQNKSLAAAKETEKFYLGE